jgi:hypothetical protein
MFPQIGTHTDDDVSSPQAATTTPSRVSLRTYLGNHSHQVIPYTMISFPQSLRLFYKIIRREAVSEVNVWGLCFLRVIINFAPRVCLLDFCSMNFILALMML